MKQLDSRQAHDLWNPVYTEKAGTLVQNLLTLLSNIRALNQSQSLPKHEDLSGSTGPTLMKPGLPGPFRRVTAFKVRGRPRVCSLLKAKEAWQQNAMQFLCSLLLPKRYYWDKWQNLKEGWEYDGCNVPVINSYFLSLHFSYIGKHSCVGNTHYSICMWWQFSLKRFREKWSSLYNTFNISVGH